MFTSIFGPESGSETSSYWSGSGKKFWILTDPDPQRWLYFITQILLYFPLNYKHEKNYYVKKTVGKTNLNYNGRIAGHVYR
jgi:hypothetical protein